MSTGQPRQTETAPTCEGEGTCACDDLSRRAFLRVSAATALASAADGRAGDAADANARIPDSARKPPPAEWFDALEQRGAPTIYHGASLRHFAFPLGGIGTGSIALHGSGRLTQWQIFNNFDPTSFVDDSFFAIRVKPVARDRPPIARMLHARGIGSPGGVDEIRVTAQYPLVNVEYADAILPLAVRLEAFNPLIPLDADDSALPCVVFRFHVRNTTDETVDVSLLATLQNAVGHSGHGGSMGVLRADYGRNVNEAWDDDGITAARLRAEPGRPAGLGRPVRVYVDHDLVSEDRQRPVANLRVRPFEAFPSDERPDDTAVVIWSDARRGTPIEPEAILEIADAVETGATLILSGCDNRLVRAASELHRHRTPASGEDASPPDDASEARLGEEQAAVLRAMMPARFRNVGRSGRLRLPATDAAESVIETPGGRLRFARMARLGGLRLKEDTEVLGRDGAGAPVVLARRLGRGRVVLWLGDLEPPAEEDRDAILAVVGAAIGVSFEGPEGRPALHRSFGTMTLATGEADVTRSTAWTSRDAIMAQLLQHGRLASDGGPNAPTPQGMTVNAALCATRRLEPGGRTVISFVYAWHFPNHYLGGGTRRRPKRDAPFIGNRYAVRFADADAVARHAVTDLDRLYGETRRFHDAWFDSSLPHYLLECLAANASTIRSQTCLWIADGTFAAYEGAGCCPMNCNHVFNYVQTIARLFPSLERNMRRTAFEFHQDGDGSLRQRVTVPVPAVSTGPRPAVDGQAGAVLKTYREHLNTTDDVFLKQYWPHARRAVEYLIASVDRDADGLLGGRQFCTYDQHLTGVTPFTTGLYIASLLAAEQMARRMNDAESAKRYRDLANRGAHGLAARAYNSEYFVQQGGSEIGDGCHADQLFGQWWIDQLGLPSLLPDEKVRSALGAVFKHNWITDYRGLLRSGRARRFAGSYDKGLLNCTWPKGAPPTHRLQHADECWTGVEYQVAATMIRHGLVREGLALVKGARERYDGTRRNPFSEIECGEHYARAMSSWSLLLACQGFHYDGPAAKLSFAPVLHPDEHRSFFSTAAAWGTFTQSQTADMQQDTLTVRHGELVLSVLRLAIPEGSRLRNVTAGLTEVGGTKTSEVGMTHELEGAVASIRFGEALTLHRDQTLRISASLTR